MKMILILPLLTIFTLMLLPFISATDINSCQTLSSSGTYTLTQNVTSADTCFTIGANDIVLDCQGYTINYASSSAGYGINNSDGYDNIVIKNCKFNPVTSVTLTHNIYFKDTNNLTIYNNSLHVKKYGSQPINVQNSVSVNVSNNYFLMTGSTGCYGVYFVSTNNSVIHSNTINSTGGGGNGYGNYGIYLSNSKNISIYENNITTTNGASLSGSHGIYLTSSQNNSIFNNNITTTYTSSYGIYLYSSSNYNNLSNNLIKTSENYGYGIMSSGSHYNLIKENQINTTGTYGYAINIRETSNYNVIDGNIIRGGTAYMVGIYISSANHNVITNNTHIGGGSSSAGILMEAATNTTITNNTIVIDAYDDLGAAIKIKASCSNTILRYNKLNTTRTPAISPMGSNSSIDTTNLAEGLPILYNESLSNVVFEDLDLSGYGQVICTRCQNVTYRNVIAGPDGISLYMTDNSTIENSFFNTSKGFGLSLSYANNNLIRNNTIITFSVGNNGVELYQNCFNNTIIYNNITINNYASGIYIIFNSHDNYVAHNTITRTTIGASGGHSYNIYQAHNNTFYNNSAFNYKGTGFYIYGSNYTKVNNNYIYQAEINFKGIYLYRSNGTEINNNVVEAVEWAVVLEDSHYNQGYNNSIYGIALSIPSSLLLLFSTGASHNYFEKLNLTSLTTSSTINYGVLVPHGTNNTIKDFIINATGKMHAIRVTANFNDIKLIDGTIITETGKDIYWKASTSGTINLTNVTFNSSNLNFDAGTTGIINTHWYLDAKVTYENGTEVEGANVTGWDNENNLAFTNLTNSSGFIERQTLLEYMLNATGTYYKTNYTCTATKPTFKPATKTINLTTNIFEFFTLEIGFDVDLISPANNSRVYDAQQSFKCNATSYIGNITNATFRIWNSDNELIYSETRDLGNNANYIEQEFNYTLPYADTFHWNCEFSESSGITMQAEEDWFIRFFPSGYTPECYETLEVGYNNENLPYVIIGEEC